MRIEELWLEAFGPFTGERIVFAPDRLNVVYGPNEAGKSTSLRAIEALLFEIEDRTKDDHLHRKDKLRVGGVVGTKSGARFSFVRRKGRQRTVLHPETGESIDDAPLTSMLGGVTRDVFRAVYGLDHVRLTEGGKDLAEGKGLVGESLFSASMGIVHLHRLLSSLEDRAGEIYLPRGQRELTTTLDSYEKAIERCAFAMTSASVVEQARDDLERRRRELRALRERKKQYERERSKLIRIRNVRPHLIEIPHLESELEKRGPARAVDPKLREDAERALDAASPAVQRIEAELFAAQEKRKSIPLDVQVLAYKDEIAELWRDRGAFFKAVSERAPLVERKSVLNDKLARISQEPIVDLGAIEAAMVRAKGAPAREAQAAALAEEIMDLERETLAELEALGLEPSCDRALRLVVPTEEAVIEQERREQPHTRRIDALERSLIDRDERIRSLEDEIAALRASTQTPTEEDLLRARERRDALVDSGKSKPSELARAIAEADRIVDRMRQDAEVASKLALRQRELGAAKDAKARDTRALEEAKQQLAHLRKEWDDKWGSVRAGSASEMRAWLRGFESARDACKDIERKRAKLASERAWLEKVRADLERAAPDLRAETVAELVDRSSERHKKLERAEIARQNDIDRTKKEIEDIDQRIAAIDRSASEWQARVLTLVRRVAPELEGDERALDRIYERYIEAERHRTVAADLDETITTLEGDLAKERARIAEARATLDRLMEAAGASSVKELREFEEQAKEIAHLTGQRDRANCELVRLGEGRSIEELRREASEISSVHDVEARIDELDHLIDQASVELDQATSTVAQLELGMKQYEEPLEGAAQAQMEAESHLAHAKELALRYVRLKLSHAILSRAIEHLRDRSQGPVLARASAIFQVLTLGSFTKLAVDLDEHDKPVIKGVRPGGAETSVTGMSDGTRDQLYLALRVASLERLAETGDPLPLVLDDVLVQFDEDRARAALGVLGALARSMQVLLFTHHEKTALLAKEAVADVVVHRLRASQTVVAA